MWSLRCTDHGRHSEPAPLAALVLLSGLLAGCASSGTSGTKMEKSAVEAEVVATPFVMEVTPEAQALYEQAVWTMASGDFIDAELRMKEFLLQYPGYPGAHVNLAIIHRENGNADAAMAEVEAALAIDPNNPAALNQKGLLLRKNGKFVEAEAAYLKAVTASPDYALAHYNLGVLNELYLQQLDVALQHFEVYQSLVGEDEQVGKWITDLKRRVAANQRTSNAQE
jgi:tetratricopeptide (TPR) repeat protein